MHQMDRRTFLGGLGGLPFAVGSLPAQGQGEKRPNVVLVMTDDQGYGDLGCHGHPKLKTPNLDQLHAESLRFTQFHVMPVCSPTRACLMTGRYNYRTGVVDTYVGRSMMHSDEVTLAEALGEAGYRTGIFGKWHLGDNYPLRACDRGFQESLVHRGGGLCQPSDLPNATYTDPLLIHNGVEKKMKGYCTDIYTDAAMDFIEANQDQPFFCYLPTNAPHTPLLVPDEFAQPYLDAGYNESMARYCGMCANIDKNVGRLRAKLSALGLAENTLFIFMTDNGGQGNVRKTEPYNAGMRGWKGSVYEGGIRVPFFIHWPGKTTAGQEVDRIAAHIDVFPTVLEACGVTPPQDRKIDGRSLMPLIKDATSQWNDRHLFFQWHRGDEPEAFRACAVRNQRYKLVNGVELYDLSNDPGETKDIAAENPKVVSAMRGEYEAWFADVSDTRGYAPPRIVIGAPQEPRSLLTRQDWRGATTWGEGTLGYWEVDVATTGNYRVNFLFAEQKKPGVARFRFGKLVKEVSLKKGAISCVFETLPFPKGLGRLEAELDDGKKIEGVRFVEVMASKRGGK
jgi:arylsulfatase A-like enzyme